MAIWYIPGAMKYQWRPAKDLSGIGKSTRNFGSLSPGMKARLFVCSRNFWKSENLLS